MNSSAEDKGAERVPAEGFGYLKGRSNESRDSGKNNGRN